MKQISDNIINHFGYVVDESSSMSGLREELVAALDAEIAWLAQRSTEVAQETRVSMWAFNSKNTPRCILWDIDALRVPSIRGLYSPQGLTALRDCFGLAIDDFGLIPEKYGRHAKTLFGLTDGEENDSYMSELQLSSKISGLPNNYNMGILVPDDRGLMLARRNGFPADNVSKWDATSAKGLHAGVGMMRQASESVFQARARGETQVRSLFRVNAVSDSDLSGLPVLTPGSYVIARVPEDSRVDVFTASQMGGYAPGQTFYRLTKAETVQEYKKLAVRDSSGGIKMDPSLRVKLGLPSSGSARVRPAMGGCEVFVQSTSHNRKLIGGTEVLMLR